MEKERHVLQDKVLTNVLIAEDRKAIKFETKDGDVIARAEGDCCSSSWIEHVELPALGFPATVASVEDLDINREEGELDDPTDHHGVIKFYGCKIVTDRGEIVIDYRNESNGYYGGELVWPDDYHYCGVFGQNKSNDDWRPAS